MDINVFKQASFPQLSTVQRNNNKMLLRFVLWGAQMYKKCISILPVVDMLQLGSNCDCAANICNVLISTMHLENPSSLQVSVRSDICKPTR